MPRTPKFRWTITVEVAECWIADGFNPTAEQFQDAIYSEMLGYATPGEVRVAIVKAPDPVAMAAARGESSP